MQHEPYHHTADDQPPPLTVVAGELTPLEIRRIQLADAAVLRAKQLADFSSPEFRSALDADELGYNAVLLTQASLPHRDPHTNTWVRANGKRRLTILADPEIGVPWGSLPRLILIWLITEVVDIDQKRRRELGNSYRPERKVALGDSLSEFMRAISILPAGARPTGGRWGSVPRLRKQLVKLFAASIQANWVTGSGARGGKFDVAAHYELWWDWRSENAGQTTVWESNVILGEQFHREIIDHHYPVDLRAIRMVKRSPLAIDLYCWLTYRLFYLDAETVVPWKSLALQFGSQYGRLRAFKEAVVDALPVLRVIYPDARLKVTDQGLALRPSPPHVRTLSPRR